MSYLNALLTDLRDRKLWPVPLVLIAALVAVPVLLSKSPSAPANGPLAGLSIGATQSGNAVTVDATPVQASLSAGKRDPFTQQKLPSVPAAKLGSASGTTGTPASTGGASLGAGSTGSNLGGSTGSTGSAGSTGSTSGSSASTGSTSGNGYYGGGGSTTGGSTGSTGSTTSSHAAAPAGLSATEAYHVSVSITTSAGGVLPIDPFKRDGTLPSNQQPLLVELGVARGAHQVIFDVQPGSVVSGPGTCTPGPLDCELLSLAPGQTEAIARSGASGPVPVAMFQITGISVDRFGSKTAAAHARAAIDPVGRQLLADSASATLSLFHYDPSLDAVVDGRNLTVGGN